MYAVCNCLIHTPFTERVTVSQSHGSFTLTQSHSYRGERDNIIDTTLWQYKYTWNLLRHCGLCGVLRGLKWTLCDNTKTGIVDHRHSTIHGVKEAHFYWLKKAINSTNCPGYLVQSQHFVLGSVKY